MRERELKQVGAPFCFVAVVAPHAGARIETTTSLLAYTSKTVAPHAGARIETCPSFDLIDLILVAPHAGARIETAYCERVMDPNFVAPHAGARIETSWSPVNQLLETSLPTWERYLV